MNADKTDLLIVRPKRNTTNKTVSLNICGKVVSEKSEMKILGVHLRNDLTWETHVPEIAKSLNQKIGLIHRVRSKFHQKDLVNG